MNVKKIGVGLIFFVLFSFLGMTQERLLPLNNRFKDNYILADDRNSNPFIGTGLFPISEGNVGTTYSAENKAKDTIRNWFARKLFHEHFIEISGDDYFLTIDPLLNVNLGRERGIEEHQLFQNTRAFQVSGEVLNRVSFYTGFYENQAKFSSFHTAYFKERGERRANTAQTAYNTINAVVPMGGRTKPFKIDELEDAFDYAQSMSYVRYRINDNAALQFGNTPNFVGWGHRSLLLSDNSFNASTLRGDFSFFDKWNYSIMHGRHLNLFRRIKGVENTVEEPFEKKNFAAQYLTFSPNKKLSIGFFHATVFYREDSISSQWFHPLFLNPVIGVNQVAFGWENQYAKNLLGLNIGQVIGKNHMLYGQLAMDQNARGTNYGVQLGWRSRNLFQLKGLHFQIEYNKASDHLYAADNWRMAYTHFNLPLAHTLGNGFDEIVARLNYTFKGAYISLHSILYQSNQPMQHKTHLFESALAPIQIDETQVLYNEVEVGYLFNPRTQLRLFGAAVYRMSNTSSFGDRNTLLIHVGLKTSLFNQYLDF